MGYDGRIRADARHLPIADGCVQCVVTSPPYWGLRDYGNDGQLGLEKTPAEYVASMLKVFRELRRVLVTDGVVWLNLGDSYSGSWGAQSRNSDGVSRNVIAQRQIARAARKLSHTGSVAHLGGIKAKDLVGIPWRVAFALQEDGWYLRRDIIWHKPNPMPESVTDRPTSSHEYIFLMTKSAKYYYNADAIAEPSAYPFGRQAKFNGGHTGNSDRQDNGRSDKTPCETRNKRSVWTIATSPYPEAHYATFPEEIPEICIKAGSKPGDLILDPFAGSGTVGRVAERLSRRWIGCDIGYQDLQEKRMENIQREFV